MLYRYPDFQDRLHSAWLDRLDPGYRAYYVHSERQVLERMRGWLRERHPGGARLLDVGAGEGRLVSSYAELTSELIVLEPDPVRLAAAERYVASLGLSVTATFTAESVETLAPERNLDVIVCSHVLQHVSVPAAIAILARFEQLLHPRQGTLLLTTAHSEIGRDRFVKCWLDDGQTTGRSISEEEFDALAEVPVATEVPSRQFAGETMAGLLAAAGFRELERRVFHVAPEPAAELGRFRDIDYAANQSSERQEMFGRDIFFAVAARER